jgi:hypothetical protein
MTSTIHETAGQVRRPKWISKVQDGLSWLRSLTLRVGGLMDQLKRLLATRMTRCEEWTCQKVSQMIKLPQRFGTWVSSNKVQAFVREFLPGGLLADFITVLRPNTPFGEGKGTAALEHVAVWRSRYWKIHRTSTWDALKLYAQDQQTDPKTAKGRVLQEAILMTKAELAKPYRGRSAGWRAGQPPREQSLPEFLRWFFRSVPRNGEKILEEMYTADYEYETLDEYSQQPASNDPAQIYADKEHEEELLERLKGLSASQRTICSLALSGHSRAEIAELLEKERGGLRVGLHRLRPRLESIVEPFRAKGTKRSKNIAEDGKMGVTLSP